MNGETLSVMIDRGVWITVHSLDEASMHVRTRIEAEGYGASHWYPRVGKNGAPIRRGARTVGWISYNGRVWLKARAS